MQLRFRYVWTYETIQIMFLDDDLLQVGISLKTHETTIILATDFAFS